MPDPLLIAAPLAFMLLGVVLSVATVTRQTPLARGMNGLAGFLLVLAAAIAVVALAQWVLL